MTTFKTISLQSGSNGNCFYVETPNSRYLFDAGISGIQAENRLKRHDIDIRTVDSLFISHDHSDHSKCAGIFHRKYNIDVHISDKTYQLANRNNQLGRVDKLQLFKSGQTLFHKGAIITTIPTPHDSIDGVGFIIEFEGIRLGILTDLGFPFLYLGQIIKTLDAVFLESNFDPYMLETGPYPQVLKRRIKGDGGHLSNEDAALLLKSAFKHRLKWACLSHLSEHNNTPEKALSTAKEMSQTDKPIYVASRYNVSEVFTV